MKLTDVKRQNIIAAAITEFSEHGFAGARTTRIAKNANVSSRTLYNHFESKAVLFDFIVKRSFGRLKQLPLPKYDEKDDLRPQLINLIKSYVELATLPQSLSVTRMITLEFFRNHKFAKDALSGGADHVVPIEDFFLAAMNAGRIRQVDTAILTQQFMAIVRYFFENSPLLIGEVTEHSMPDEEIMSTTVDMFLSYYGTSKK